MNIFLLLLLGAILIFRMPHILKKWTAKAPNSKVETQPIKFYRGDILSHSGFLYEFLEYEHQGSTILAVDEAGDKQILFAQDCDLVQRKTPTITDYNQFVEQPQEPSKVVNPQQLRAKKKKLNKRRKLNRIAKKSRQINRI